MPNGNPPAPVPAPPPADRKFSPVAWLGNLNNLVTTAGALVAAAAAVLSTLNKSAIEQIDRQVKSLDLRTKNEQTSRDYANIFINQLLSEDKMKKNDKRVQALLSILNIVAQASGSDEGRSNAKTRAMTPIVLALLLGEPGGVAQMDESYEYLDDWVAIACADNSYKTRVTAILALGGMCQKALRAGRLDIVVKGVRAVDQLLALIPKPEDPKDPDYISVLAARSQLASFIKREDRLLDQATDPDKNAALGEPAALRAEVRAAFSDANAVIQETKVKLEATVARAEQAKPDPSQQTPEAKNNLTELKGSLAQINAALSNASQIAVAQIGQGLGPTSSAAPAASPGSSPGSGVAAVKELIKELQDKDAQVRRRSRSQLGLLGQNAVKPLLEEVAARFGKNKEEDYRLRLGAATALNIMAQPIALDSADAYWVVSLLRSNDRDTRLQTSEFLMNLEKDDSVLNCFDELEKLFNELCDSPKDGLNAVTNAAVIVGTWARNLTPDTASHIPNVSMMQVALQAAKAWKKNLADSKSAGEWENAITALNELIQRAEAQQKNTTATLVTPK